MAARVCREALPSLADSSARLAAAIQDSHSAHGGAQQTGESLQLLFRQPSRIYTDVHGCQHI